MLGDNELLRLVFKKLEGIEDPEKTAEIAAILEDVKDQVAALFSQIQRLPDRPSNEELMGILVEIDLGAQDIQRHADELHTVIHEILALDRFK